VRPLYKVLVGVQAVLFACLVGGAIYAAGPADDPFSRLMDRVRVEGAKAAVRHLGPDILKAAERCPADQLAAMLARAQQRGCRTVGADAHEIQIECGDARLSIGRWADGFRAVEGCPPFLAGMR
jgi:hypothetical protein